MEFNCPQCATPHSFPDDQIPDGGILVACTHCETHITLDRSGVLGEDMTEAIQQVQSAPEPSAPAPGPSIPPGPSVGSGPSIPPGPSVGSGPSVSPGPAPSSPPAPAPGGWPQPAGGAAPAAGGWPQPGAAPAPAPAPGPVPTPAAGPSLEKAPAPDDEPGFGAAVGAAFGSAADAAQRAFDDAVGEEMAAEEDVPEGLRFPGFAPGDQGPWCWRDLPKAFVGLLDPRRVAFTTVGLWLAIVAFALIRWLSSWLGGKVGILGTILDVVAWAVIIVGFALVTAVMSFVCHQTVIERRPSSIKAGITWVKSWIKSVAGTPLAFAGVIAAAVLVEAVLGLIGRIPFAGPIIWGLTSPVTAVLTIGSGLVAVALVYSLPLYVPVIYNEKTGPAETLKRLLSLFRAHGLSLVGYLLLSGLMIAVSVAVTLFPALALGRTFTDNVLPSAMGDNLMGVFIKAPEMFRGLMAGMVTPAGVPDDPGFGHTLGGILGGVGSALLPAIVLGLVVLVQYTAGCIIYSIVTGRKKA